MRLFRWICSAIGTILVIISIIYIVNHFDQIAAILPFDKIKDFISGLWSFIVAFVQRLWGHIKNW